MADCICLDVARRGTLYLKAGLVFLHSLLCVRKLSLQGCKGEGPGFELIDKEVVNILELVLLFLKLLGELVIFNTQSIGLFLVPV